MPRPAKGYTNAAGDAIPGTHDPISRFMDQTALKFWAYKRGQQGLPLFDRAAIDIGSAVHRRPSGRQYDVDVAEREYNGRTIRKITKATPANGATRPAVANGSATTAS